MNIYSKSILVVAAALAYPAVAFAEPVEREGVIVTHTPGQLNAQTKQGPITVVITHSTVISEKKGLSRKTMTATSLIPGLIFKVEGEQHGDSIEAAEINYTERDWRSAIAAKAGTHDELARNAAASAKNAENISMLKQAMIDGHEYVIRQELAVFFPTGKATISAEHMAQLRHLAQQARSFGNYRISILGFADPRGDAAANERLSMKRAGAVSNFLRQTGSIEPGRVLSPSAMGEGTAAPGETPPASDAEARRVVVRVVTPKGQPTQ